MRHNLLSARYTAGNSRQNPHPWEAYLCKIGGGSKQNKPAHDIVCWEVKIKYCGELPRNQAEQEDGERFAVCHKARESFTRKVALNKNFMEVRKQTTWIAGERAFLREKGASANALRQEHVGKFEKQQAVNRKVTGPGLYCILENSVRPLDFSLRKRHRSVVSRGRTSTDVSFKRITLFAVLSRDCKGAECGSEETRWEAITVFQLRGDGAVEW